MSQAPYDPLEGEVAALLEEWRARREIEDEPLFPRLVLGWTNADFRVQIRIFQHFSRSTRKSSSRKQICKHFANFHGILQKILESFGNFQKKCKILQNFAEFLQIFLTEFCKI